MPELPEIETIRRDLEASLQGHQVIRLSVNDRRLLSREEESRFRRVVSGQAWRTFGRRGKYLTVDLASGWQVIFHLRMTGQMILGRLPEHLDSVILRSPRRPKDLASDVFETRRDSSPSAQNDNKRINCRMFMQFDHGIILAFYDQRRFGEIFLKGPRDRWPGKTALGPDPLNGLSKERFISMVKEKTARIKPLLMDQSFLSGVGNIYSQEALFKAGLRPARPSFRLTQVEAGRLYGALRETLNSAISHRGSSSRNYRDAYGRQGTAQDLHAVYRRGGKPCLRCHSLLKAIRMGGRGTVYCPQCQR